MRIKYHVVFFLLLFTTNIYPINTSHSRFISFDSKCGMAILENNLNVNALKLISHFITQKKNTYCGIASIVMVLNSTNIEAPVDTSHNPYRYFTQDNIFNSKVNEIISEEELNKNGINLLQLSKILEIFNLKTKIYYSNFINLNEFRELLKDAILNEKFIIVNFLRSALFQDGGGHHSPVADYDIDTDRFLILDVARYKYRSFWVKSEDLWNAVNTSYFNDNRGFVIIDKNHNGS